TNERWYSKGSRLFEFSFQTATRAVACWAERRLCRRLATDPGEPACDHARGARPRSAREHVRRGVLPRHGGKLAICEEGSLGKTVPSCSQSDRGNHSGAWRRPTDRPRRGGRLLPAKCPAIARPFPPLRCGP